jgi:hypothetical protein
VNSFRTAWRQPPVFLTAVAMVLIFLYWSTFVRSDNFEGYWVSTVTNATIFLIFSCSVSSVSAAIAAARARRGGLWGMPSARGRARIAVRMLWPALLGGVVAQFFGLALLVPATLGAPGRFPVEVCVSWLSILLLHTSIGFLLGRFLPMVASIPLAIFVTYAWLGFTWAVDYFPIRYLSGLILVACCSVETRLDERAVQTVVVFSVLAAAAIFVSAVAPPLNLGRSLTTLSWTGTIVCITIAAILGLNLAHGLGAQPLQPRPQSEQQCSGSAPVICLFPEQYAQRDPRLVLTKAYANLRDQGVAVPNTISGGTGVASDAQALRMVISTKSTPELLVRSLAASLLPDDLAPYCGDGSDYGKRVDVAAVATWWLASVAGTGQRADFSIPTTNYGQEAAEMIGKFQKLTPEEQRSWYFLAVPALSDCAAKPLAVASR